MKSRFENIKKEAVGKSEETKGYLAKIEKMRNKLNEMQAQRGNLTPRFENLEKVVQEHGITISKDNKSKTSSKILIQAIINELRDIEEK